MFEGEKEICEYKNLRTDNNKEDCVNQSEHNYQLYNLRFNDTNIILFLLTIRYILFFYISSRQGKIQEIIIAKFIARKCNEIRRDKNRILFNLKSN